MFLPGASDSEEPLGDGLPGYRVLRAQASERSERPVGTYSLLVGQQMQSRGPHPGV